MTRYNFGAVSGIGCGLFLILANLLGQPSQAEETLEVINQLPQYQKVGGVSGNLSTAGSDSLANLMALWTEAFKKHYPNINIQVQAAGSSTAPPALVQGTANIGAMSRTMKNSELLAFENKYGYAPTAIPVAIDAMAIYVHKDNPIQGLTIAQLDAIFSVTRRCGYPVDLDDWAQLGIDKLGTIELFGRNSVSGTYGYFKSHAMCKGDFKSTVNEQLGSAAVVQSISRSLNGIGYSGIGYFGAGVRVVPLALEEGQPYIYPVFKNVRDGSFPLSRSMYLYVNKPPNIDLSPLENEFIRYVLSRAGQQAVVKDGYLPVPAARIKSILSTL